ncbi:TlpA family protein disulfide reductase [Flaviaesturariibacter terrae]
MTRMLAFLLLSFFVAAGASAQPDTTRLPYLRFPTLPPLQLLLGDSSTLLTKDDLPREKPTLVMYFSTGCGHCQHTTEELVKYKDSLPDMNLVMATFASITDMNNFRAHYGTDSLPHTFVGKDIHFLLPPFYGIANLPFFAFYDKNGQLAEIFDGSLHVPQIIERVRQAQQGKK